MKQGFSEVIGSWKIIAMSRPMIARRALGLSRRRSCPQKSMRSAVTVAVQGSSPMTASMDTDLPDPDSPTIASTSSVSTAMSTPSTAAKAPLRVAKRTVRLRMSRSFMAGRP